jgi:hypothetical protein
VSDAIPIHEEWTVTIDGVLKYRFKIADGPWKPWENMTLAQLADRIAQMCYLRLYRGLEFRPDDPSNARDVNIALAAYKLHRRHITDVIQEVVLEHLRLTTSTHNAPGEESVPKRTDFS